MGKCTSCFSTEETKPVQVRRDRETGWVSSSVLRCANDECWHIRGGDLSDILLWLDNVYEYKYFGDYELSPEQISAVWKAKELAKSALPQPSTTTSQ